MRLNLVLHIHFHFNSDGKSAHTSNVNYNLISTGWDIKFRTSYQYHSHLTVCDNEKAIYLFCTTHPVHVSDGVC